MQNTLKTLSFVVSLTCVGIFILSIHAFLKDLPLWSLIVLDLGTLLGIFCLHSLFILSQQQKHIHNALKTVQGSQKEILGKMKEANSFFARNLCAQEDASLPEVSQAVFSELHFMRSLLQQISDYHAKILIVPEHPSSTDLVEVLGTNEIKETHEDRDRDRDRDKHKTKKSGTRPLSRAQLLMILQKALKQDRVEMLLQPIVSLPQRKRRHCECFSRIKDEENSILQPDHYISIAQDESLISIIDNTLIFRCIQLARKALKKNLSVNFFCNISNHSLKNQKFLDSLKEFFSVNPRLARHIMFELDHYSFHQDHDQVLPAIEDLARNGCHFSLDNIQDLSSVNFKELKKNNFKFLKVEVPMLLKFLCQKDGPASLKDFKKKADQWEIDVILTKVEEEQHLVELLEFNFDFGQGYLFGAPQLGSY